VPRQPFANAMKQSRGDAYLAPEYISGAEVDGRADVYSLGVLIGEMLAGVLPDGSAPSLRDTNRDVPERVDAIYQRAVNANPLARFARAMDLAGELSEIARTLPPSRSAMARRSTAPPPLPAAPSKPSAPPPPPPGELRSAPISL